MIRRGNYLLFIALLFLSSCGRFSEVTIGDISGLTVQGIQNDALIVVVNIPVENPTHHRITINEVDLRMSMNKQYVGKILLNDKIIIPANSDEIHEVSLKVRMANLITTGLFMMNMKKGQKVQFRLEGSVTARSLMIKREILVDELREVII